jgi:hypothetical protein
MGERPKPRAAARDTAQRQLDGAGTYAGLGLAARKPLGDFDEPALPGQQFRRIIGYRDLAKLVVAIERHTMQIIA